MRPRERRILLAAMLALAASSTAAPGAPLAAAPAAAPPVARRAVIELFTSQGCPKCPPADKLITALAAAPGTIALTFPVNYWDYSGWKDTLASPAFSDRQHAYAATRGDRDVFTPQAIVDGVGVEPGTDRAAILRDTASLPGLDAALSVPLSLSESSGTLHIDLGAGTLSGTAGVYVLRVARAKTVQIDRGANSGQRVTYTNVVRALSRIGEWRGKPAHFDVVELEGDGEGYVVLLQAGRPDRPGAILAAAKTGNL